ncbi:MAG: hypothetical protein Q8N04_03140 [Nitrospira sp.]|nr:hypothetical protein [Nitrospira sp.]
MQRNLPPDQLPQHPPPLVHVFLSHRREIVHQCLEALAQVWQECGHLLKPLVVPFYGLKEAYPFSLGLFQRRLGAGRENPRLDRLHDVRDFLVNLL